MVIYKENKFKDLQFYDFYKWLYANPDANGETLEEEVKIGLRNNQEYLNYKAVVNKNTTDIGDENEGLTKDIKSTKNRLSGITAAAANDYDAATNELNTTVKSMNKMIDDANAQHKYNTDVLIPEIKDTYTKKIKTFVNSLANSLTIIRKQLYIAYVTPNLVPFIDPFRKVYNSIYDSFMKSENREFIKKYYPSFNLEKEITAFKSPDGGVQDLSAKFESSDKIQSVTTGMKQM